MSSSPVAFDAHSLEAIEYGRRVSEEARLGHIGTEHLLLGLLETPGCSAARVLAGLGVTLPKVEDALVEQAMRTQRIILSETMASSLAEAVFAAARERARAAGRAAVTTSDLLVALVQEHEGVAAKVLRELDVGFEEVAHALSSPGAG